ncbi:phosphatidylglycerol phosphatidylinositol transfer protein [Diaporthe eres]|uniref:Phosphatidylglycerol/phosphatidylinositol transfer protein n=1 Tax=Diaporthe vaccinii TaxID=105482 RepID=A0ABR4F1N1_9PEZI|nr:phosphatidylglycerol phosphatidylinositol transfer protein [Diaporthe eres]
MKLSTVLTAVGAAIASSGNVGVPDISDDPQGLDITGGTLPPTGEKIPGENSFSFCKGDRSFDAITITHVDLVPNPPIWGQDLVVSAVATVNEPIVQGAVVDVKVKFISSVVYHKQFDVCEELGKIGHKCPVAEGTVLYNETWPIPKGFPHGTYGINAFARYPGGHPISCVDGKLKM